MEWVETTAETIDDAKALALDRLGVDDVDAEFEVVEEPKAGLLVEPAVRLEFALELSQTRFEPKPTAATAVESQQLNGLNGLNDLPDHVSNAQNVANVANGARELIVAHARLAPTGQIEMMLRVNARQEPIFLQ